MRNQTPKKVSMRGRIVAVPDAPKTPMMRQVELRIKQPLGVYLQGKLRKHWTEEQIAVVLHVDHSTISRWVKKLITIT